MSTIKPLAAAYKVINKFTASFVVLTFVVAAHAVPETLSVQAPQIETLLISDVDDTIKVTHVLDTWDTVQNALRTDNIFLGMTSVYQMLANSNGENLVFAYLSNAPESIMYGRHEALLKNGKFPVGDLFCRENTNDDEHKNRTIRALVDKYRPKNLILIGDNAEQDTMIYSRAAAEYPDLNVKTYIHQLYSVKAKSEIGKKLEKGQLGFVTAVDLALHWYASGLAKDADFKAWVAQIAPKINQEASNISKGVVAFPSWMDCRDYSPIREQEVSDAIITQYVQKRDKRCQIR